MKNDNIKLVVLNSASDFGLSVNENLKKIRRTKKDYIIPITNSRFSNGEGKLN